MTDFDIDFVAIAEKLPKLVISGLEQPQSNKKPDVDEVKQQLPNGQPNGQCKTQKISIQPRICSKLWESLRKSLRDSFKMELEFFDQTRQRTSVNFWEEALRMFRQRLRVYLENQDLLTIKQTDYP
jgi:hypothetical protein